MGKEGVFRSSAVERLSTPDRLDQPLQITTPFGWVALSALAGLIFLSLIASIAISVPVKVRGDGIIITAAGVLQVPIDNSGRVAEILVRSGQHVRVGSAVARMDQPELKAQLDQARADERDIADQRARVVRFQSQSDSVRGNDESAKRRDLDDRMKLINDRLADLRERQTLLDQLYARQLINKQRVVENRIDMGKTTEELADNRRQMREIVAGKTMSHIGSERELLDLDLKLAAATRKADDIARKLHDAETVISPYSGTVVEFRRNQGELVQQGTTLLTLLPDDRPEADARAGVSSGLIAMIYVPGAEGKKIAPGMTVEISPSTFNREEYGFMLGKVRSVAAIPATEEGMMRTLQNRQLVTTLSAGGAPFEVQVALDRDAATATGYRWSTSKGPNAHISPGTLAGGQIWVREIRLIEFIIPALRRVFHDE